MKPREDYTRLVGIALLLSLGILVAFEVYQLREAGRIQNVEAADSAERVAAGQGLFEANCTTCHGQNGEGDIGPALNDKTFLSSTEDGRIFSLISSGVPGTAMPAWSQLYGGPFTDEQINDLVGFIRHWEATAQAVVKSTPTPDAAAGQVIFDSTCYACHGTNGQGTDRAPALNSKDLLTQFDDNWFRQTISAGRPAKGMPTWGNVLSPEQIDNVVAYIRSWQATAPTVLTPAASPSAPPIVVNVGTPTVSTVATAAPTSAATSTPTVAATATLAPTSAAPTSAPAAEVARPSNGNLKGGPALNLTGNATNGAAAQPDRRDDREQGSQGFRLQRRPVRRARLGSGWAEPRLADAPVRRSGQAQPPANRRCHRLYH
jgi:mono/diheme cytochrome c family protein